MAGIYIHIPYCKQACHYCDFHFSTSLKTKDSLLDALVKEFVLRKEETQGEKIETIYVGGGTPSILSTDEIQHLFEALFLHYDIVPGAEITLEANPDDLTLQKIAEFRNTPVNRFSIGVQSFHDEDLLYMNRVHNASMADRAIKTAQDQGFENLTVDLIYGTPTLSRENWISNIRKLISYSVPHASCYALTVEEKTPLASLIKTQKRAGVNEDMVAQQFFLLHEMMEEAGFEHYELSNFARPGFRSRHNSSYWAGETYLGFGPGAHSFNGFDQRRWNIANNVTYIRNLNDNQLFYEVEHLSEEDRYNEFIMTKIRLKEGISWASIREFWGDEQLERIKRTILDWNAKFYHVANEQLVLSMEGLMISDKLASDLFMVK